MTTVDFAEPTERVTAEGLIEKVTAYNPGADTELICHAFAFAERAHRPQTRASGEPYITHPLAVADILAGLKLDDASLACALLHDTVEDTEASPEEVEREFGAEIRALVDGVTKLSQLELHSEDLKQDVKQAENFRKLLMAIARDVRVLLVKLADRLHNMRTLGAVSENKRQRVAQETMEIYAPLAGLVGMQDMREELEDLSFQILNPGARESVLRRLKFLQGDDGDLVSRIADALQSQMTACGIEAEVLGREKRPHSIWRKMERKAIHFEQLSDIFGFRIIVPRMDDCYRALGALHTKWQLIPGRFKDYVSTPKRNGYRSLHTTVIGPEKQRVEIQIRTQKMQEEAEFGLAAHWRYKDGSDNRSIREYLEETRAVQELRNMIATLEQGSSSQEFLENTKLEMFFDQVYCFTPKGDLISLPRGATPVDFAYAVHTDIGDTCVGARINGHHAPLRSRLDNGDMVEIIRSNVRAPRSEWESFTVTGKARSAIRRFVRQTRREQLVALGKGIIERAFAEHERDLTGKALEAALPRLKMLTVEDLYEAVGQGVVSSRALLEAVFPGQSFDRGKYRKRRRLSLFRRPTEEKLNPIAIRGLTPGLAVHMAKCCHPLPGDRIVGIVEPGAGVMVHTIDCEQLEHFQDSADRWLDLSWNIGESTGITPVARLKLVVKNMPGTLGTLSQVVANAEANISNLKFTERHPLYFEMLLDVEVEDVTHLNQIVAGLRASDPVEAVERVRDTETS